MHSFSAGQTSHQNTCEMAQFWLSCRPITFLKMNPCKGAFKNCFNFLDTFPSNCNKNLLKSVAVF